MKLLEQAVIWPVRLAPTPPGQTLYKESALLSLKVRVVRSGRRTAKRRRLRRVRRLQRVYKSSEITRLTDTDRQKMLILWYPRTQHTVPLKCLTVETATRPVMVGSSGSVL